MEKKTPLASLAQLTGAALMIAGTFAVASDLFYEPQGVIFEGVIAWSAGLLLLMMVSVAEGYRKSLETFTTIYNKQVDIQQYLTEKFNEERQARQRLAAYNQQMMNQAGQDLSNPEDMMKAINNAFTQFNSNFTYDPAAWAQEQKSLEELEKELDQAVAAENFEKAAELRKKISKIKGEDGPDQEPPAAEE